MTDEEIKAVQDENIALKKENNELKTSNTKLGQDIAERDGTITELQANAKERGEQFRKLKDYSVKERELLSEKELELLQRQEQLENEREEDKRIQKERDEKMKNYAIDNLANKFAKGNKDIAEQIKINLGKLNPALLEGAITEEDFAPHVESAFKLTGIASTADPLRTAHNTDGINAPIDNNNNFADTKDGKDLASAMGLSQATTPEAGGETK
jgi:hypothetical protein